MLVHPLPLSLMEQQTVKDVQWTPFNTAISPAYPSLLFVPKGLIDSKECPMDSFNTVFNHACSSLPFVLKGLKKSKECPLGSFNTALIRD